MSSSRSRFKGRLKRRGVGSGSSVSSVSSGSDMDREASSSVAKLSKKMGIGRIAVKKAKCVSDAYMETLKKQESSSSPRKKGHSRRRTSGHIRDLARKISATSPATAPASTSGSGRRSRRPSKTDSYKRFEFGDKIAPVKIKVKELFDSYGLFVWPSAILLAEYLFANPHLVAKQCVLELGSGCALPSVMAAKMGARRVHMTDGNKVAVQNASENAKLNGVSAVASSTHLVWGRFPREVLSLRPDVIIAADVFYAETDFEDIIANVQFFFDRGADAFVTVIANRGTMQPLAGILKRWNMHCAKIDISALRRSTDYLSLDESEKLMLCSITSHKVKSAKHASITGLKSVLGFITGTPSYFSDDDSFG